MAPSSALPCLLLLLLTLPAQPTPLDAAAACARALAPQHYLPHADASAWCALAAAVEPPPPCAATAAAVCGVLLLRAGNLSAGAARLGVAVAARPHDWVSHSYLGAAAEYAARQLLPSANASARERALEAAWAHFSVALEQRRRAAGASGGAAPLPAALLQLAQPAAMLYRSAGTALAWLGRRSEAAAVYAAGVREGTGWVSPLQRPTRALPQARPCPTPFLPRAHPRLAALLGDLEAALPALRAEYAAASAGGAGGAGGAGLLQLERAGLEAAGGGWGVVTAAVDGALQPRACAALPLLCALCARQPLVNASASGQVKYSVLAPGARILPHAGPTLARLRVHCTVEAGWLAGVAALRVGGVARRWREGRCLVFDESFEHEVGVAEGEGAGGAGAGPRVVLILDIVNVFLARLSDVREHGASAGGWQRHGQALTALWEMQGEQGEGERGEEEL